MHLQPNQQLIIDLLKDGQKHCTTAELYMKDDRARISALRKLGFKFNEDAGNCKDLTHKHGADLKLRQLIAYPSESPHSVANLQPSRVYERPPSPFVKAFLSTKWVKEEKVSNQLTLGI